MLPWQRSRMGALAARAPAPWTPTALSPVMWADVSYAPGRFQEITGASATTLAKAANDPIGSLANRGAAGGWFQAAATGQRPLLGLDDGSAYALPDGVDDKLVADSTIISAFSTIGGAFWIAAGWQQPSGGYAYGAPAYLLDSGSLTATHTFYPGRNNSTSAFGVWTSGSAKLSAALAQGKHSIVAHYDGTVLHKSIDGSETTQTVSLTPGGFSVAWLGVLSGKFWGAAAGYGTLSTDDVANLHAYYTSAVGP